MQRFKKWQNNLEAEPTKIVEKDSICSKIEYKGMDPYEKQIEAKVFIVKKFVTKQYLERKAAMENEIKFGIGQSADDIKSNSYITSVQRENVWHPYYEIKTEEEDFKEKLQRNIKEASVKKVEGENIELLKKELSNIENLQKEEEKIKAMEASGETVQKKRAFDIKALQRRKQAEEEQEANIPQEDPYGVKLKNLTQFITEDDIRDVMIRFGEIQKVRIPMEQSTTGRLKNRGFAFVTYSKIEHANRAIQEGEVEVDNMCLEIERAMKTRPRENKEQMLKQFDILKRNK